MMEAAWYTKLNNGKVRCLLCPHKCLLSAGEYGKCRVRRNLEGILFSEIYGKVSSMHVDPIEKKPLYHYFPGKSILSVGTVGCNLSCNFCQNCEISQISVGEADFLRTITVEEIIEQATKIPDNIGIAYTYNEPSIWIEFVSQVAQASASKGLRNVLVTNGFINPAPLGALIELIDAFSVDLKGYTESFYRSVTGSNLLPVKHSLEQIRKSGRHLEVVNLVIPGLNDSASTFEEMVKWIAGALGSHTVLHLSAYYPRYLAKEPVTPAATIQRLADIASRYLNFVYAGNLPSESNITFCPVCKKALVKRKGYQVEIVGIKGNGECSYCGKRIFENF